MGSKLNPRWLWLAFCRQTRQIAAHFVGDRSADCVPASCVSAFRLATVARASRNDLWLAYTEVFSWRTHRLCGKGAGETSHFERFNHPLRQRLSRFVHKTLPFPSANGCTKPPCACSSTSTISSQSLTDNHHRAALGTHPLPTACFTCPCNAKKSIFDGLKSGMRTQTLGPVASRKFVFPHRIASGVDMSFPSSPMVPQA